MKSCPHCSTSGIYIDYSGQRTDGTTIDYGTYGIISVPCKFCKGIGYIDEDEYTDIDNMSDGRRDHCLGNSIVPAVAEEIFRRIKKYE